METAEKETIVEEKINGSNILERSWKIQKISIFTIDRSYTEKQNWAEKIIHISLPKAQLGPSQIYFIQLFPFQVTNI